MLFILLMLIMTKLGTVVCGADACSAAAQGVATTAVYAANCFAKARADVVCDYTAFASVVFYDVSARGEHINSSLTPLLF